MKEYEVNQVLDFYLDLRDVFAEYGYPVNRAGFCCCPFHRERTASCRVDNKIFHCFGCGEAGNAVSFIKKMFKVDFTTAIQKLNDDFRLNLLTSDLTANQKQQITQRQIDKYKKSQEEIYQGEIKQRYMDAWKHYVTFMPTQEKYDINTDPYLVEQWFTNLDKRWIEAQNTLTELEDVAYVHGYNIDLDTALAMFTK